MKTKPLFFAGFAVAAAALCILQFRRYADSFEAVIPHEHLFRMHEPEEEISLDLNAATASQLSKLPNVSRPLADRIVAYRKELGGFSSIRQLLDIPEMPESLYLSLGEYIYLTPESETEPPETTHSTETTAAASTEAETTKPPMPETIPPKIPETQPYIPDPTEPFTINLNTASLEDLLKLPDCSETTAQEILALRDALHGYSNTLEITYAESVTPELYLSWETYLAVDDIGNQEKEPAS